MHENGRRTTFVATLVLLLLSGSSSLAQEVSGNLEGQVVDDGGKAIVNAAVTLGGSSLQGVRDAVTDKRGFFRIPALPPGLYAIRVQRDGYHPLTLNDVRIALGKTTGLGEIRLRSLAVIEEKVVVTAPRPLIDPRSTASGGNISAEYFANVPTDRNYRSIAELLPHVNVSYLGDGANYSGGAGLDNRYFVDGIDVTDPWRGIAGTDLPYNFIKEVDVKLGGYQAEYRSALGGTVNVITHSGSNEFRSNVWGYFTSHGLAGDLKQSVVEQQVEDYSKYDVGFSASGPLIKDRLWYYAAYSPTFADADVEVPGVGFFRDEATTHSFAGKLTWQIDGRNNLIATVIADPTRRDQVSEPLPGYAYANSDPLLRDFETGGFNLALRGTHILSQGLILESWFSGVSRNYSDQPATQRGREEWLFLDEETSIASGGSQDEEDSESTQLTLGVKAIWMTGNHELRAGLSYRDNKLDRDTGWHEITRLSDDMFLDWTGTYRGTVRNRVPSLFIQDSWRANERWLLNFGLRWDGQYLIGSDGDVAQRITDQYQPRIGFVYLPGEPGSQRLYGSAGRFYHDLTTNLSSVMHLGGGSEGRCLYDHDPRVNPSGCVPVYGYESEVFDRVEGIRGQHYDELSLGYERSLAGRNRLGVRAVYRTLGEAIVNGIGPDFFETGEFVWGNPGRGDFGHFPSAHRDYKAIELTFARQPGGRLSFLTSYVWSENEGNYAGLFDADWEQYSPNLNASFKTPGQLVDAHGKLPNDRTHVFKFSGSYRFDFGLTAGTFLTWQSGTPLSEFGGGLLAYTLYDFASPRGTAGRTPTIFDLNLRLTYDLSLGAPAKPHAKLHLDVFHLFSDRDPVDYDQVHYFALDENGNQTAPNPLYGTPTRYQPPTSVRLGVEFTF